MATVKKDIEEESDKINKVKKLVRKRVASLKYKDIPETPLSEGTSWKDISFLYPERTVRLGTLFSGIGAIEHAFQRLGLKHKIVFAGDIEPNCKKSYFAIMESKNLQKSSAIQNNSVNLSSVIIAIFVCNSL